MKAIILIESKDNTCSGCEFEECDESPTCKIGHRLECEHGHIYKLVDVDKEMVTPLR